MTIQQHHYQLQFLSPAFLGNANQSAQWRTPPIKALLRQWWRVAYAADKGFQVDVAAMRREEGLLFGHAWLEDDSFEHNGRQVKTSARKSALRLRLSHWDEGKLKDWQATARVTHPEVKNRQGEASLVGSDLYLGYGPLAFQNGGTGLKNNAAIQADASANLSMAFPDAHTDLLQQAIWLMDRFGALGGRSRNGWGSFQLTPEESSTALQGKLPLRNWQDALLLDWPHAIGQDSIGPLMWQTQTHADWKNLMKALAEIKIALRTQFKFPQERPDGQIHARHWLSYPVTRHEVNEWKRSNLRLPNSLRFKVRPAPQNPRQLVGVIFHMPCLPPSAFNPKPTDIAQVWQRVHGLLDNNANLNRIPA